MHDLEVHTYIEAELTLWLRSDLFDDEHHPRTAVSTRKLSVIPRDGSLGRRTAVLFTEVECPAIITQLSHEKTSTLSLSGISSSLSDVRRHLDEQALDRI